MYIGIDVGYNAVKIYDGKNKAIFPSVVGTPDKARFSLRGDSSHIVTIPSDGTWMVGAGAVEQSRFTQRREDRGWIDSDEWYRLFIGALSSINASGDVHIVTGLPIAFFDDAEKLKNRVVGRHSYRRDEQPECSVNVIRCRVVPQPFGTLLNYALNNDGDIADPSYAGGTIGIIDVGGKTTNILSATKLAERLRQTTSVNIGGWDIVRAVRRELEKQYPDLEIRDHDIANAVVTGKIKYYGADDSIVKLTDAVIHPFADQIIAEVTQVWNRGANIDKILITGGGAMLIGKYLTKEFKHAIIVEDPIFSNVMGYWKFGLRSKNNA
jgi:plasmid segregation protein ParM